MTSPGYDWSGASVYDEALADDPHERVTTAALPPGMPFSELPRISPGPGWRLITTVVAPSPSGACMVALWWERPFLIARSDGRVHLHVYRPRRCIGRRSSR